MDKFYGPSLAVALLEWKDPTKFLVGYDNPCSEEDMNILYAATTITLGNGCKSISTPLPH
jgi:hypothetical protein